MNLQTLNIDLEGAKLIIPPLFQDDRGFFKESYVKAKYHALGIADEFVQDSLSVSSRGVLRGLHADPLMSKLVYVVRGEVFDVIVDTRSTSATFGKWHGVQLSEQNGMQLYVPAGFLHGFLALTDDVVFCYKQSAEYAPGREIAVRFDDPTLGIEWPLDGDPRVSPKDLLNPSFSEAFGGT